MAPRSWSAQSRNLIRHTAGWSVAGLVVLIAAVVTAPASTAEEGLTATHSAALVPSALHDDSQAAPDQSGHYLILGLGFVGQGLFGLRFVVQWIASEKSRTVVVPRAFWWLSLAGALLTGLYALAIHAWPILLSQIACSTIYARNLSLSSPLAEASSALDRAIAAPADVVRAAEEP